MNLDLSQIKNVHFIGIGGIGISAIARMMILDGKSVSGQDMQDSEIVAGLRGAGANISIGQSFENIPKDTDLIVYTIAIEYYDPELFEKIKSQNVIPVYSYPEMLKVVTSGKYTIAIAGTHGKTTTTAMIGHILREVGFDPSMIIGSLMLGDHSNFWAGKSEYFVVEACEYRRSFLNITPKILVITNIDEDHLDYYKDIEDIKSAFRELAMKVPNDGYIVCDTTLPHIKETLEEVSAKVVDSSKFFNSDIKLKIPGIHNRKNASNAKAVADCLNIDQSKSTSALESFPGTWRRFEFKGTLASGAKVYDDYAHHPTEVVSCLQGFREFYPKEDGYKITVIFQPHLFSRTKALLKEFGESFYDADKILILPIYYAREEDDGSVSATTLADAIGESAKGYENFEDVQNILAEINFSNKDIIVTMGAGEAFKIGDTLLNK